MTGLFVHATVLSGISCILDNSPYNGDYTDNSHYNGTQ